MKKIFLFLMSFIVILTSVFSVTVFAETYNYADDMTDDDMNVNSSTTTTTKSSLGGLGGSDVGDFVGGVVSDVFQDEDVSEGVADKFEGILGIFDNIDLGGIGDKLGSLGQTTQKSTVGSGFFDTIDPVITGGSYLPNTNSGTAVIPGASETIGLNGEAVDFSTGINPYQKPVTQLNPGDKGDGVKWLQWILIYTGCGLQGNVTGEYDDATTAAVKTLQLKYGLNVDGIATLEVIEKADEMYNSYVSGAGVIASNPSAQYDTNSNNGTPNKNKTDRNINSKVTAIIVGLIILWIFAIAAVLIIVYIKKKNISLDDVEKTKPKKAKKSKTSKRTSKLSETIALKESETLKDLSDDDQGFDIVDFNENDYDEDGEVTLSSLYEMKKKAIAKNNSEDSGSEIDTKEVTLKTESDFVTQEENQGSEETSQENSENETQKVSE